MGTKKKKEIDKYLFQDNIRRLFLADMLRRKPYLNSLTIKQLDSMVSNINTLLSNLNYAFKDGKMMIDVSDDVNWEHSRLFRDIFLHNVLDVKINCGGTTKDFKQKLTDRWKQKITKEEK